ncbi:MAG: DUF3108 domain-containing protein [Proteobacteria bacterium]|nr:DUF3108 domain-containing protein [Pseudomonadota bacterium]
MALLLLAAPAEAKLSPVDQIRNLHLSYAIYLGGVHIMDSTTAFTREGPVYNIAMQAGTQGFTRSLIPWDADLNSTGRMEADAVHPANATIATHWQKKPERVEFQYADNDVKAEFFPVKKKKKEYVPQEMRQGSLDPLNSVVQLMTGIANGKGCAQQVPVFDGKRRFDVALKDRGSETLKGEDYSIFNGAAQKCAMEFTLLAGSPKDREDSQFWENSKGNNMRPPIFVYLGQVRENLPPLPVRAETETPFGSVMVHLTGVDDGTKKAAAKNP